MKKLALIFAVLLGAAVAETDGAFVGAQLGFGGSKVESRCEIYAYRAYYNRLGYYCGDSSDTAFGLRFGVMGGYKHFFSEKLGMRYYGVVDYGKFSYSGADVNTLNLNANADVLYNFASKNGQKGIFGGLSLGWANHDIKSIQNPANSAPKVSGFDLGVNLGFRANFAQNHGIEIYSRFGLLWQRKDESNATLSRTNKLSQPYAAGFRYVFSF